MLDGILGGWGTGSKVPDEMVGSYERTHHVLWCMLACC